MTKLLLVVFLLWNGNAYSGGLDPATLDWIQAEGVKTSKSCHPKGNLNFGVVLDNPYYTLYRSSGFGKDGYACLKGHLKLAKLPNPRKVLHLTHRGYSKTAWSTACYLARFPKSLEEYSYGPFAEEERNLGLDGHFEFVGPDSRDVYIPGDESIFRDHLKPKTVRGQFHPDRNRGDRNGIYNALAEVLETPGPVSFHCMGGLHRTGILALLIRNLQGGDWTAPYQKPLQVSTNLSGTEKTNLTNLAELEYYLHNADQVRDENLDNVNGVVLDARFQCLKRQFSCYLNAESNPESKGCFKGVNDRAFAACPQTAREFDHEARQRLLDGCTARYGAETEVATRLDHLERILGNFAKEEKQKAELAKMSKFESVVWARLGKTPSKQIDSAIGFSTELSKVVFGESGSHYTLGLVKEAVSVLKAGGIEHDLRVANRLTDRFCGATAEIQSYPQFKFLNLESEKRWCEELDQGSSR